LFGRAILCGELPECFEHVAGGASARLVARSDSEIQDGRLDPPRLDALYA
jgi:hypothetical protein